MDIYVYMSEKQTDTVMLCDFGGGGRLDELIYGN